MTIEEKIEEMAQSKADFDDFQRHNTKSQEMEEIPDKQPIQENQLENQTALEARISKLEFMVKEAL